MGAFLLVILLYAKNKPRSFMKQKSNIEFMKQKSNILGLKRVRRNDKVFVIDLK